jgi:uncharacterized tellurite resistance protein B-like protein
MSERILKALMQLFAIIAGPNSSNQNKRRDIVSVFLQQQLNEDLVDEYLKLFDKYYELYQKKQTQEGKRKKSLSLSSVKVLKICTQINEELDTHQKIVVLVRLLEFIKSDIDISEQELEFVYTVADIFHFPIDDYNMLKQYVISSFDEMPLSARMLLIDNEKTTTKPQVKHLTQESLKNKIWVIYFPNTNMYMARCFGENEIYLNGQLVINDRVYVLRQVQLCVIQKCDLFTIQTLLAHIISMR